MLLDMFSPAVLGYVNSIGGFGMLAVSIILIYPRIRHVELELPDAFSMNRKL